MNVIPTGSVPFYRCRESVFNPLSGVLGLRRLQLLGHAVPVGADVLLVQREYVSTLFSCLLLRQPLGWSDLRRRSQCICRRQ